MPQVLSDESLESTDGASDVLTLQIGADRPIRISSGHRLLHHDGKCSRPHGHNYEISVDVRGNLTSEGWIVDKGEVTSLIDRWDHRFLLQEGDPLVTAFSDAGEEDAVVVLPDPPTAEIMSVHLRELLLRELPPTVEDVSVRVAETGELAAH